LKPFLQVSNRPDTQFEAGSEILRLGNTIATKLEQGYQPPFLGQENFEP